MNRAALVVDDDPVSRLVLCHMLKGRGWAVDQAADVPAAVTCLGQATYDVVVCDFHLPSGTGLDVLAAADVASPAPAFVLVTGMIEHPSLPEDLTVRWGAHLTKPVSSQALDAALEQLFPAPTA